jgi:hypothetical protein
MKRIRELIADVRDRFPGDDFFADFENSFQVTRPQLGIGLTVDLVHFKNGVKRSPGTASCTKAENPNEQGNSFPDNNSEIPCSAFDYLSPNG